MAEEYITIAGVRMDRPGFVEAIDPTKLLALGGWRGENTLVQTREGRVAQPRVRDELTVLVQFLMFGKVNHAGVAWPSRRVGVRENLAYLQEQHLTGGLVTVVHTFEDDEQNTGQAIVEDIVVQEHDSPMLGRVLRLTYDLTFHAGRLERTP